MPAQGDIASLLLNFPSNPAAKQMLCAYITRTGVTCKDVRSHSAGKVEFDIEMRPEKPGEPGAPAIYSMMFDALTGQPRSARLERLDGG